MKYTLKLLTAVAMVTVMACGNSEQKTQENIKTDTATSKKIEKISQTNFKENIL